MMKWLARSAMVALLAFMCSVPLSAFAQDGASLLSTYLDQTAAANNLPSGDGNISPVEQSLALTLIDGATGFNQTLTSFEQSSPENAAWISNAQQNLQNYNQEMAANANAPVDVRADIISNAVAQYGQDIDTMATQGTYDPRADIISNAVAQYGMDAEALQVQAPNDPRADAISKAVAQYGQQIDVIQAQAPFDPRASAISEAVAQYGRHVDELNGQNPLSGAEKQAINKTVRDTSNHYIDDSDIEYKELVKQHLQRLIDNQSEELPLDWVWPTEGIWTRRYGNGSTSGDCSGEGSGDNGGMGAEYYNEDDPNQQTALCISTTTGIVFLDGNTFRWDRNGSTNTYITETTIDSYDNSSSQRVMSVIDDYNIDVVTTRTSGSCTVTNVIHYSLYIPGSSFVCSVNPEIHQIDEDNSSTPSDNPENSSEIIVDPIKAGEYSVTWLPTDQYCVDAYKPSFTQAAVTTSSFDNVKLTINGQTYNLSGDGMRGEFSAYENNLNIALNRRLLDDFNIVWQASSDDNSESCSAQGVVKLETPAASQPNHTPPAQGGTSSGSGDTATGGSSGGATALTAPPAGDYDVTWTPMPGLECAPELKDKLPDFSQITVSDVSDNGFVLGTGSENYSIQTLPGIDQWMFTEFTADNSGVVIAINAVAGNTFSGTYTYFAPDGNLCFMNIEASQ